MNINKQKNVLDRRSGIGGSDATKIVSGEWKQLYQLKKGLIDDEDLSFVLPVQMGIYTEDFNKDWFTAHTDLPVQEVESTLQHKKHDFMLANLDGYVLNENLKPMGVFEAKHVHAFTKDDTILEKYYAQIQHYMIVSNLPQAWLSILFGNNKWKSFHVQADKKFQKKLIQAEEMFWQHIINDEEPADYVEFSSIGGTND
jgi:predicted phage-related endonuclease